MSKLAICESNLWSALADGKVRPDRLATRVLEKPALLPEVFAGLREEKARVKFGCAKVLMLVSERNPEVVFPYWNGLVALLENENKILQWSALLILGNLAQVAPLPCAKALLPRLLAPIRGPVMITAANAMRSLTCFGLAHSKLAEPIARAMLEVERAEYQTAECRNVALGHAIRMLGQLLPLLKDKAPVLEMVRRQLGNSRHATRKKAEVFLKNFAKFE